ncbi:MAG: hypothetical protein JNL67_18595 [Planctomycetaceae bacterium]|nr:hypothetical protein [Planctomycetaceae bacterium]
MALTTCSECSGNVSTKAETCPHCGAPVTPPNPTAPNKSVASETKRTLIQTMATPFVYLGIFLTVAGIIIACGNQFGTFPTFPFAGFITMTVGSILAWFSSAVASGTLRQETSEIIATERERSFRMETGLSPIQSAIVIVIALILLGLVIYWAVNQ